MLDLVVDRRELKTTVARVLRFMGASVARTDDAIRPAPARDLSLAGSERGDG
jgi:hypothetical protein